MKLYIKSIRIPFFFILSFPLLTSFNMGRKDVTDSYQIQIVSVNMVGNNQQWTWSLVNPNPGNGTNGTLQDIGHWSVQLNPDAEAALVSAEYSYDGVTWHTADAVVDRDPSIKICTTVDVLKYTVSTSGTNPSYCRMTLNTDFPVNQYSTSWIKTGGGQQGCNLYYFSGIGHWE
jgi:hypothetical protein